jgi:NifU-like protein involved in Fe-S cluster formation
VEARVNAPLYTIEVLRLAASLPDPEPLEDFDGSAEERSHTCGSKVATQVRLDEQGRVAAISQRVEACAFGQASSALVARHAAGRSAQEVEEALGELVGWLDGNSDKGPDWPGFGALAPVRSRRSRHSAVLLPFKALLAAIRASAA